MTTATSFSHSKLQTDKAQILNIINEFYDRRGCNDHGATDVQSKTFECILSLLQDWLSPAKHSSHVRLVAQWYNADFKCPIDDRSLTSQFQPTTTPSRLGDETAEHTNDKTRIDGGVKTEQHGAAVTSLKFELTEQISQRITHQILSCRQASNYAEELFSELTLSEISRIETYLINHGPEFISGILYQAVLEATVISRNDALQCLINILAFVVNFYCYYVDCLSATSRRSHKDVFACLKHQESLYIQLNLSKEVAEPVDTTLFDPGDRILTLFHLAVSVANVELVRQLLKSSADQTYLVDPMQCKTESERTTSPLHIAAGLSLQLWASVVPGDDVDSDNTAKLVSTLSGQEVLDQVPLFYAELLGREGNERWRLEAVKTKWLLLSNIRCERNAQLVDILLNHGADVNASNSNGQTPLGIAESLSLNSIELACAMFSEAMHSQALDSSEEQHWPIHFPSDDNCVSHKMSNILLKISSLYPACTDYLVLLTRKYAKINQSIITLLKSHNSEAPRKRWAELSERELFGNNSNVCIQENCLLKNQELTITCSGNAIAEDHRKNCELCSLDLRKVWKHDASLNLLLECGVSVNVVDVRGQTALHVAAEMNRSIAAKLLLDRDAYVTIQDLHGETPLVVAVNTHSWQTARTLLDNNKDIVKHSHGEILVHSVYDVRMHSDDEGPLATQKCFYRGYYKDVEDSSSWILESYQEPGRNQFISDIFKELFFNGFDVNARTLNGETLLHGLCSEDDVDDDMIMFYVQLLLNCGANINAQNMYGQTPLHCAIVDDKFEVATCLLQNGADANVTDIWGDTPFHIDLNLIEDSYFEYYNRLLDMQERLNVDFVFKFPAVSEPNLKGRRSTMYLKSMLEQHNSEQAECDTDCFGNNMLHWISVRGRDRNLIFREPMLEDMNNCSSYEVLNIFGQSPVHVMWQYWCRSNASPDLNEFLEDNLKYIEAKRGSLKPDSQGRNVWHYTSLTSDIAVPREIIRVPILWRLLHNSSAGQLCNEKDHFGRTPLHYTAMLYSTIRSEEEDDSIIDLWRESLPIFIGSVNEQDIFGRMPVHYLLMNCSSDQPNDELMKFLVEHTNKEVNAINDYTPPNMSQIKQLSNSNCPFSDHSHCGSDLIQFARSCLTNSEQTFMNSHVDKQNITDEIWQIWTELCHCAYRDEMFNDVREIVVEFMKRLTVAVGKEDDALQSCLLPVGSAFEGTQIDRRGTDMFNKKLTYDFDFTVELNNVDREVKVYEEKASGIVTLKQLNKDLTAKDLQKFFNDDGYLESRKLNIAFRCAAIKVLSASEFWLSEPYLEIANYDELYRCYQDGKCLKLTLKFTRLVNGRFLDYHISVDVVPALRINGWWPTAAAEVDTRLQEHGCYFVFGETLGRKILFSPSQCVRVAFAPVDSQLMKDSPPIVKAAYIVAKKIVNARDIYVTSIALKMAALWSSRDQESPVGATFDDIIPSALHLQVGKLFCALLQFAIQDFVPHVLLPTYHMAVWKDRSLREFHESLKLRGLTCETMFRLWCQYDSFDHSDDGLDYAFYLFDVYCQCCQVNIDHVPWNFPKI